MSMVMGCTSAKISHFKRRAEEFSQGVKRREDGKELLVGEQSKAVYAAPALLHCFNRRSLWLINSPELKGEFGKEAHSKASHTLSHTEPAISMYATEEEIIDYLARREAQRVMDGPE